MNDEEVKLLDYQMTATIIFVGSLILSIYLTYNDKLTLLKDSKALDKKTAKNLSIFNRVLVIVLSLVYLYVNYRNNKLAEEKHENIDPYRLQIMASELSILASIIVLYVVVTNGNYNIIADTESPEL